MSAHYELKIASNGQFLFNLKAPNGEIILTSETYTTREAALDGIELVRSNAPLDERYDRRKSHTSIPYFVLKADNHEIIGRSETYSSLGAMEKGIESVKKNGPLATLNDHTLRYASPRAGL
jgi:uncharacterized protein YegP (UPF0339 family)